MSFNAWDGNKGEIGQRRALSTWMWMYLEPEVPAQATVYPPLTFLCPTGKHEVVSFTADEIGAPPDAISDAQQRFQITVIEVEPQMM